MTLIHLFRKYKAWNPVHPTAGAFWGFGIGAGCGVGWGPGFGPQVIGYVGSGCGVGLSVGMTLVGFGIGLPSAGPAALPWETLRYTARQGVSRRGEALRATLRAMDWAADVAVTAGRRVEASGIIQGLAVRTQAFAGHCQEGARQFLASNALQLRTLSRVPRPPSFAPSSAADLLVSKATALQGKHEAAALVLALRNELARLFMFLS